MDWIYLTTLLLAMINTIVCDKEVVVCKGEEFITTEECHYCNDDEIKTYDQCKLTGYIEIFKCESNTSDAKSCDGRALEVRTFWHFEIAMIVSSVISGFAVMLRMRRLDRENSERIQRQISAL